MSRTEAGHFTPSPDSDLVFESEAYLVTGFCEALSSQRHPWRDVSTTLEFGYIRGRTDVVAVEPGHTVIAFEAKLADWRGALQQAYRNTCFAHESFVLLPKATAIHASQYLHEFRRRGVGICYLDAGEIVVLQPALNQKPLQPWLAREAVQAAGSENGQ